MDNQFSLAKTFLSTHARLLERRLFEVIFEGANPSVVGRAVAAYQNPDGGLGHALEPDLRCPESQPIFVDFGLGVLYQAGCRDQALALELCGFLDNLSDARGLVPAIQESALRWPRAGHWGGLWLLGLNPTAGICGLLHYQGVEHPWLARATQTCVEMILEDTPADAHTLRAAAHLAEHLPDRETANRLAERIAAALPQASFFIPHAPVAGYGLTPLHFAATPGSIWRPLFTDEQIAGHLDDLAGRQQADGGWPIGWDAPGPASVSAWRGRWTLDALMTLAAYDRIDTSG